MIVNKFIATKDHVIIYTRYTEDGDFFPYLESDHPNAAKTNAIGIFMSANCEYQYSTSYDSDGKLIWNKLQDVAGPHGSTRPIYDFDKIKGFGSLVSGDSNTSQITIWTKEYMNTSMQDAPDNTAPKPAVCVENAAIKSDQNSEWNDIKQDSNTGYVIDDEPVVVGKYSLTDSEYQYEQESDTSSISTNDLNIDWGDNESFKN